MAKHPSPDMISPSRQLYQRVRKKRKIVAQVVNEAKLHNVRQATMNQLITPNKKLTQTMTSETSNELQWEVNQDLEPIGSTRWDLTLGKQYTEPKSPMSQEISLEEKSLMTDSNSKIDPVETL